MCNKTLKHSAREIGIIATSKCDKPEYLEGLCKKHYMRSKAKLVNWGDRDTYRPATIEDIERGRSLKLKNSHKHELFMLRKGVIKKGTFSGKWIDTEYTITDVNLFCVLDY